MRHWDVVLRKFLRRDRRRNVVDEEEAPELEPEPEESEEEEEEEEEGAREAPEGIRRGLEHAFDSAGEEHEN